ncbi:MAG: dipeptidase PepE [Bacteroidetes Order II. Incertae sedis bacterium]|jgi:dipeptidase E|nr:dipeptidase PepE [Bacteroidetes Order II. bacterium]MBT4603844.1 dipeptidase PepE [Bacteroidetes Order II. bacterium]MBT5248985.1 dipeptidase PepE [Bacteroidetes Order II. bacterium]MBT6200956.1 dipeptidase PepE [Bacteroidetes Order II. bacterium]MBT6580617.1 dipeptidase PepE [Bacteroidetes Order II. bacterium]
MHRKHLLMSTSRTASTAYLEHGAEHIDWLLGSAPKRIAFVPYAAVRFSFDKYEAMVANGIQGHEVVSVHHFDSPLEGLKGADAIAVGGGNTFQLVHEMYRFGLMDEIREMAQRGVPFIGWSAGSNVTSPRLCTTNDMPIIEPPSFKTLNLISAQINPHYLDAHPDGHMGETRAERLEEFITLNPGVHVIALREGAMLKVDGDRMTLEGIAGARLFHSDSEPREFDPGADLSFLL